jgi:hypothetical protein
VRFEIVVRLVVDAERVTLDLRLLLVVAGMRIVRATALDDREAFDLPARGGCVFPWSQQSWDNPGAWAVSRRRWEESDALRRTTMGRGGIEPPTLGLRVPCSAN